MQSLVPGPPPPRDESARESVGREGSVPTTTFHMKTLGPTAGWEADYLFIWGFGQPHPHPVLKPTF